MSFTLTTSGAILFKAGKSCYGGAVSGTQLSNWCDMAEGLIVATTHRDWVTGYAGLSTPIKNILNDVCSDLATMKLVSYDMSGYLSKQEAPTILNFLKNNSDRGLEIIKNFNNADIKAV